MKKDEGVERVRDARKKISQKCDNDIHLLVQYYLTRQDQSRRKEVEPGQASK